MSKKIILVGYMGSGKTMIGKLLSENIQIPFIDLDNLIEETEKSSINSIFETKGELYFRKTEHKILNEILNSEENLIIATGGGTPCYYNNHEVLQKENVISIYLKASIKTLFERLKLESTNRPLLLGKNDDEIQEFIAKHLFERNFYYNNAKLSVIVDGLTPQMIVNEIIEKINFQ